MAISDSYRRNINRKQNELLRLQQNKAKEIQKQADLSKKINSATQAISRTNSTSLVATKLREIDRHEKAAVGIQKNIAKLETQCTRKETEITKEKEKLNKEIMREQNNFHPQPSFTATQRDHLRFRKINRTS
ncbi:hypothetical protein [Halodesulfovibrio aestuarii]|uniref:hypothetical protein n=1 Tax=Halodesulfovibrio aestuarii TaxID=126333 RepID=UPI003D336AF0